jgi:prepilin-type N-terminal cleavage/methylation domain-containing protein
MLMVVTTMTSRNKFTGFTIVELIIVISIIGILATIGLISWNGAQKTAKQNAATTTLAKVKLVLGDYYTDSNVYPVSKAAICDAPNYTVIPAGDLYDEFCVKGNNTYYTYAASPASCDNTTQRCTTYVLTASKTLWGGTTDATVKPS